MDVNILFFLAGLVGAALRAISTYSHDTFSPKTVTDVIIGGATGVLYPNVKIIQVVPMDVVAGGGIWAQAALVLGVSYVSASLVSGILGRVSSSAPSAGPVSSGVQAAFGPQEPSVPEANVELEKALDREAGEADKKAGEKK